MIKTPKPVVYNTFDCIQSRFLFLQKNRLQLIGQMCYITALNNILKKPFHI